MEGLIFGILRYIRYFVTLPKLILCPWFEVFNGKLLICATKTDKTKLMQMSCLFKIVKQPSSAVN